MQEHLEGQSASITPLKIFQSTRIYFPTCFCLWNQSFYLVEPTVSCHIHSSIVCTSCTFDPLAFVLHLFAGSDITPINDIVNVNPVVESTTCVFVQINNDEVSEPNEVFQLQLVLRSNGPLPFSVMIFRNTTLFTIVDDDRPGKHIIP